MDCFTEKYFKEEYLRFHKMITSKDFWKLPLKNRDAAIKGLVTVYMRLDADADLDTCAPLLEAALDEYHRRESHMLFHPAVKIG